MLISAIKHYCRLRRTLNIHSTSRLERAAPSLRWTTHIKGIWRRNIDFITSNSRKIKHQSLFHWDKILNCCMFYIFKVHLTQMFIKCKNPSWFQTSIVWPSSQKKNHKNVDELCLIWYPHWEKNKDSSITKIYHCIKGQYLGGTLEC